MTSNTMTTTGAPYALGLGRDRRLLAVASLAEASWAYRLACDAHMQRTGQGSSTMPEGKVYDATGTAPRVVARISWNGRVWANKTWAPGDAPLYDPATALEGGAR